MFDGTPLGEFPEELVFTRPRRPLVLIQLGVIAVGGVGLASFIAGQSLASPYTVIGAAFLLVAVATLVAVIREPGSITIDAEGFTTRHPWVVNRWSWVGTSGYFVRFRGAIPNIYFRASADEVDTRVKWLFSKIGSLPRYGVNVNDLLATLEAYRQAALSADRQ